MTRRSNILIELIALYTLVLAWFKFIVKYYLKLKLFIVSFVHRHGEGRCILNSEGNTPSRGCYRFLSGNRSKDDRDISNRIKIW
jgi:hypothetical protein